MARRKPRDWGNKGTGVTLEELFAEDQGNPEFIRGQQEAELEINLAIELARARKRANMTQAQLAKAIGSKQSVVSRIESAGQNVTIGTLDRIARALGHELQVRLAPQDRT